MNRKEVNTKAPAAVVLRVTRQIEAPREAVFAAWTTPEKLRQWFSPGSTEVLSATADLRAGGEYDFRVKGPGCEPGQAVRELELRGVYREIKPPVRVIYTWNWHGDKSLEFGETRVTVDFLDKEGVTAVQVTHEGLPNPAALEAHKHGWNACLDKLEQLFAKPGDGHPPPQPGMK